MEFVIKELQNTLSVTGIVNVHFFEFPMGYQTANDSHPFYELVFVSKGVLSVHSDSFSGILKKNQMIIHRPNEIHRLVCAEDVAPTVIIVGFSMPDTDITPFSRHPTALSPDEVRRLSEIVREGRNVFAPPYNIPVFDMKKRKNQQYGSEQLLKSYLEAFILCMIRKYLTNGKYTGEKHTQKLPLREITAYLDTNYKEKLLIDEIVFMFQTNRTTLCKVFRDKNGMSITDYLNTKKLEEAKRLLGETTLSVTEISEKLNFTSIHYFTRLFTKKEGISPSQFRTLTEAEPSPRKTSRENP